MSPGSAGALARINVDVRQSEETGSGTVFAGENRP